MCVRRRRSLSSRMGRVKNERPKKKSVPAIASGALIGSSQIDSQSGQDELESRAQQAETQVGQAAQLAQVVSTLGHI